MVEVIEFESVCLFDCFKFVTHYMNLFDISSIVIALSIINEVIYAESSWNQDHSLVIAAAHIGGPIEST